MSTIAGIDVSPDHYIGGRRVPSAERFEDRSPIDWAPLAEVSRGGAVSFTAAVYGTADGRVAWLVAEPGGGTIDAQGSYQAPATAA